MFEVEAVDILTAHEEDGKPVKVESNIVHTFLM